MTYNNHYEWVGRGRPRVHAARWWPATNISISADDCYVGVLSSVYAAAIVAALLGLLFVMLGTGDRERELLAGGVIGIVLLLGLGTTPLL